MAFKLRAAVALALVLLAWAVLSLASVHSNNHYRVRQRPKDVSSKVRSRVRVASWNVWFASPSRAARRDALLQSARKADVDVLCLQEVLPSFAESVRKDAALMAEFDVSPFAINGCEPSNIGAEQRLSLSNVGGNMTVAGLV